jgi:uncharacterized protein
LSGVVELPPGDRGHQRAEPTISVHTAEHVWHGVRVDLDDVLRCLADADAGRLNPDLCDGRYVAVTYDDVEESSNLDEALAELPVASWRREASTLYEALDLLADHVVEVTGEDEPQELLARLTELDEELVDELREAGISSPPRQLLAAMLMDAGGPVDIVTEQHWCDAYLGESPLLYVGARFVFLASAAPPNQDFAVGILELQPTGAPGDADRALAEACRAGVSDAAGAALAAGASVNGIDERGISPLHVAVAYRHRTVVEALLAAGADAGSQSEFGNAPQFAALDVQGRVGPYATRIDGEPHWQILSALIDAGVDVNAANRTGATLLDLAVAMVPYPTEIVDFLLARDARCAHLQGKRLPDLARLLPYPDLDKLRARVNEVRILLRSGVNPNVPVDGRFALNELFLLGYHEDEVPGEILLALTDELISHGAADLPDRQEGRTALDRAEAWLEHGLTHYGPTVERLRTAPPWPRE